MGALNIKIPNIFSPVKNATTGMIGLYLGLKEINLVQIDRHNDALSIRSAASIRYPLSRDEFLNSPKAGKKFFNDILSSFGFKGRQVVATLPTDKVKLIMVSYQHGNGMDEAQSIVKAIDERSETNLDTSVVDYILVNPKSEQQGSQSVLAAIADKRSVTSYLEGLRKCNLSVQMLEIGPIAINRLICGMQKEQRNFKVLVVNFGVDKSFLTVSWGGRLLLDRGIDFGVAPVLDVLEQRLGMERDDVINMLERHGFEENSSTSQELSIDDSNISHTIREILKPLFRQLAKAINEVLVYTASETQGGAIEQIYLFGSIARWRGADQLIDQLITLPISSIPPFFGIPVKGDFFNPQSIKAVPGMAVATGLALRGMLNDP